MSLDDDIASICEKLDERASRLDQIVEGQTVYYSVRSSVQRSAATIRLCSVLLQEAATVQKQFADAGEKRLQSAKASRSPLVDVTTFTTTLSAYTSLKRLSELAKTADLISNEKDVDSLRILAIKAAETVAKIAMILSGVELLKVAGEIVASALDIYDTGKSTKNRINQAKIASNLLQWLETAALAGLAWSVETQRFINHCKGQLEGNDDDTVIDALVKRTVTLVR